MRFGGGALVCLSFILFGRCNLSLPSIFMPIGPNEAVYRTLGKLEQHNAHNAISRNTQKKEKETPSVTNSRTHSMQLFVLIVCLSVHISVYLSINSSMALPTIGAAPSVPSLEKFSPSTPFAQQLPLCALGISSRPIISKLIVVLSSQKWAFSIL